MTSRKSDYFIVLGRRESRLHVGFGLNQIQHGEGNSNYTQRTQETSFGNELPRLLMPTSLSGIVKTMFSQTWFTKTSIIEEPGAVVSHAGICGGSARQLAVLRRLFIHYIKPCDCMKVGG